MTYNDLRRGRVSLSGQEYLVTTVTHNRQPVFNDFAVARLMVKEMRHLQENGSVRWLAWVIMPDHLHGLLSLEGERLLSQVINQLKGRSAKLINRHLARQGSLWQPGFHDHALRREEDRLAVARYVVANPLRGGLVSKLADYPHWDSIWL